VAAKRRKENAEMQKVRLSAIRYQRSGSKNKITPRPGRGKRRRRGRGDSQREEGPKTQAHIPCLGHPAFVR
jgi:hypothetical protein